MLERNCKIDASTPRLGRWGNRKQERKSQEIQFVKVTRCEVRERRIRRKWVRDVNIFAENYDKEEMDRLKYFIYNFRIY